MIQKKGETLTLKEKLNDKIVSIELTHHKSKGQSTCFYDAFYSPKWKLDSVTIKVNNQEVFSRLNVLYCLFQDVSDISLSYKDGYFVMNASGGDGAYGNFWELWFDEKNIRKTIIFASPDKNDTTTVIVHKEVVYD